MAGMNTTAFAIFHSRAEAETAVSELTAAGFPRQDVSVLTLASVRCDSSEEVSRAKDILKSAGGEDVASAGEKPVSSHTDEKYVSRHPEETSVHSPDTIDAYRDREPRVESPKTVDTINAYRAKEPRSEYPEGAATEEEILDSETRTPTRRAV